MATNNLRQYRPITTEENQGDDSLTVRILQEGASAVSNYKAHFGPVLIPASIYPEELGFLSEETYVTERVQHVFAPRDVGFSYNYVYETMEGNIRLHHFNSQIAVGATMPDLPAVVIPTYPFKYMIIGGEALQTADGKGIDLANHDDIVEKLIMQR